jgi:hypothetical protein
MYNGLMLLQSSIGDIKVIQHRHNERNGGAVKILFYSSIKLSNTCHHCYEMLVNYKYNICICPYVYD